MTTTKIETVKDARLAIARLGRGTTPEIRQEAAQALVAHVTLLGDAIEEIERMHAKASEFFEANDVPGGWLDEFGSWKDWESEAEGSAAEAERDTLERVLALLKGSA